MAEKQTEPRIRFAGYDEPWEQRKLGECFDERQERSAEGELISVTTNDGIKRFSELGRHDNSSNDKSHYKRVKVGDIAYNSMRMWQGASGYSPHNGIVSPAYTVVIPKPDVDSMFFSFVFKKSHMIHTFQVSSQGITSDTWNLKFPSFSEIETTSPEIGEQKQIASFLASLDHLITLQRRKYDKLCTIKKSLLASMFPQQGESKPKMRFAGFTDDWEQRKCKDTAPLQRGFDLPTSQMIPGKYPVVMSNGVGGYHSVYKVRGPGVITGRSGTIGNLHYIEDDYWPHNTALWVTDFKSNSPKFIYYLYQHLDLSRFGTGSGVPTLNRNDVHDTIVAAPKLDEQKRIASLSYTLDHLITLHHQKLEKLKTLKVALLEAMFV